MRPRAPSRRWRGGRRASIGCPTTWKQAVRTSMYGRPGAVYLDFANDVISGRVDEAEVTFKPRCPDAPRTYAEPNSVEAAIDALKSAERPLVIVGRGMAYSRAEDEVREFIDKTQLPFLASPMGKGVVPDDHPLSVAPARSHALQNADLVFLMGARMNWIMHFGLPPRFNKDVRVVQMDISAEEIGTNVPTEVALVGDAKAITSQLNAVLEQNPWSYPQETTWWTGLSAKAEENRQAVTAMEMDDSEADGLLPRAASGTRGDSRRRDHRERGRQHDGHRFARCCRNILPRSRLDCGHVRDDGRGRGPGHRRRRRTPRPQGRGRGRRRGLRLQRDGGRGRLPLRAADHLHRGEQQRHRRRPQRARPGQHPRRAPTCRTRATRRSSKRSGARATS